MKIKLATKDDALALEPLLNQLSAEVYGVGSSRSKEFIENHWAVYLCCDGDEVVGFSSYNMHDNYGLDNLKIANDYLFVKESHRGTKATYLLMLQSGKIISDFNFPLEHYYASDGSERLSRRLKGKKIYTAYAYESKEVLREFSKLKKVIGIKE